LLVQLRWTGKNDVSDLEEFSELARSAGANVVGTISARIDRPSPKFFVGSGKADEIAEQKKLLNADLILVNHALSPVQERNLEQHTSCRVVDRTGLILDIFAQRARSHEGKLQVELAQLKHISTRLVRGWTHLDSQRGGSIGLRGPGETQLEIDRRLLAERVKQLTRRLEKVEIQRNQARRARQRNALPVIALVGYTNAGKSTLFNTLTGAHVYAADQLFATLDPTLRRIEQLACGPALLADTVGFIRDLPHDLIAAFKSTLAEAREADLLLHVADASSAECMAHIEDVQQVLEEIGADPIPQILVFNKLDRLEQIVPHVEHINGGTIPRVWVSAIQNQGIDLLRSTIEQSLIQERIQQRLHLPAMAGRLRARLFELGLVVKESPEENGWLVEIDAPRALLESLFGLPDGEGAWLRQQLLAVSDALC